MKSIFMWFGVSLVALLAVACGDDGPYFIAGTAQLPPCDDPPAFDLDGTAWFDQGEVEIMSAGCDGAMAGDMFESCPLNWTMRVREPGGNDLTIIVDNEYKVLGRLCDDTLYLRGGWWLPVEDEGMCTYAGDSASEVGIQDGGSSLTVTSGPGGLEASGVLMLRGPCEATYDMTLSEL